MELEHTISIGWPQGIYLTLNLIGILYIFLLAGRGEAIPNTPNDVFARVAIWMCIILPLLWWGGFFGA